MKYSPCGFALVAALLTLSACGQKGSLVLPDAPKHKRAVPSVPGFGRPSGPDQRSDSPDARPPAGPQQAPIDAAPTPPAPGSPPLPN